MLVPYNIPYCLGHWKRITFEFHLTASSTWRWKIPMHSDKNSLKVRGLHAKAVQKKCLMLYVILPEKQTCVHQVCPEIADSKFHKNAHVSPVSPSFAPHLAGSRKLWPRCGSKFWPLQVFSWDSPKRNFVGPGSDHGKWWLISLTWTQIWLLRYTQTCQICQVLPAS